MDRRSFIHSSLLLSGSLFFRRKAKAVPAAAEKVTLGSQVKIFRSLNGGPEGNMKKIIELMGGIDTLFGEDDIIIIKPNLQWWNQGAPNLSSFKTLVELIMNRPGGFKGEVILMENTHRGNQPWQSAGWAQTFERNSDLTGVKNMSDLTAQLKQTYGDRFTVYHLVDISAGGKRVFSPEDGAGYVYCDGTNGVPLLELTNGQTDDRFRATIMTYPILKTDRGTVVDFKNGIWEQGQYTNLPLRFINLSALNHHSSYCGMTSAIKNYLGICDLSDGPDPFKGGKLNEHFYNFHSFPFDKWQPGPTPGMLGAEISEFMRTVCKADLNITTAEYVGLVSRTEPPVAHTRGILASRDPVALDYHAAKYFLYPNSDIWFHNPDDPESPLRHYLKECAAGMNYILDERFVEVQSYDFNTKHLQADDELTVKAEIEWGANAKALLKYVYYRMGFI